MKTLYDVPAPAKLNLFLHLTGRRADGYHLLQSAFMLIDWCDVLHFELRRDGRISRADVPTPSRGSYPSPEGLPHDDLTVRAARALQSATGTALGVHISLEKRLPVQAGLGGGSSDAASCLLALQRLWRVELPAAQLMALAVQLGADVPFFLLGRHAWVEGIGEQLSPITLPAADFLVIKPSAGLSTETIFRARGGKPFTDTATILGFAAALESAAFEYGQNDLEPVARGLCEGVDKALHWLAAQGLKGRMTGSGSAVFAYLPPGAEVPSAGDDLPGYEIRRCRNLQFHPLAGW